MAYALNLALAVAWGAVTGSFSALNLAFGFAVGAATLWLFREPLGTRGYFRRTWLVLRLAGIFVVELVKSATKVALTVIRPKLDLAPAIIAYPLTVKRDFEITLLANLVTLTPGTLSVDVSEDRRFLYVHCLDAPDVEAVIADIRNAFERRIAEAFE
jgi:multicomponent Na+:H+ antiporter subunit E